MIRRNKPLSLTIILLLFTSLAFFSCSEKITSAGEQEIDLRIDFSNGNLDSAIATTFILTITGPGIADPIKETLVYSNGFLTGTVKVPAGPKRRFRIDALDDSGLLIYSGETVADVASGTEVHLGIDLYPRVPMVKISPMYAVKPMGTLLPMHIKIFNIENLHTFDGVLFNYGSIMGDTYYTDDVALNPLLKKIATLSYIRRKDGSVQFRVVHIDAGGSFVDINGNIDLLTIYIQTHFNDWPEESIHFYTIINSIKDNEGNDIPREDIYREDADIALYYYESSIIAEWKMGWGTGSEDPSWIEDTSPNALHGTATGTIIGEGAYGNARYFDGYDDFIEIPDNDLLDLDEGITVSFWLNVYGAEPQDAKQPASFPAMTILSKGSENGPVNYEIIVEDLSSTDYHFTMDFRYGNSTMHTYRAEIPDYMLGRWNHYVFSCQFGDPSSALLVTFPEGMQQMPGSWITGDGRETTPLTDGPLLIGKDNAREVARYYSGGIDDIELFDAAFDMWIIQRLYAW